MIKDSFTTHVHRSLSLFAAEAGHPLNNSTFHFLGKLIALGNYGLPLPSDSNLTVKW